MAACNYTTHKTTRPRRTAGIENGRRQRQSRHHAISRVSRSVIQFAALLLSFFLIHPSRAESSGSLGSQAPFALSRPALRQLLPFEDDQLHTVFGLTNTFNRLGSDLTIDAEIRTVELQTRTAINDQWSVGAHLSAHSLGGGISDGFIERWDEAIGYANRERERSPRDRYRIRGINRKGERFQLSEERFTAGALSLEPEQVAYTDRETTLSIYGGARLPLESNAISGSTPDPYLGVRGKYQVDDRFSVGAGFQGALFLDREQSGFEYAPGQLSAFTRGEYLVTDSLVAIVALSGYSALVSGIARYPDFELYIDIGASYRLSDESSVECIIRENPYRSGDTPDVSAILALNVQF